MQNIVGEYTYFMCTKIDVDCVCDATNGVYEHKRIHNMYNVADENVMI